MSMTMPFRVIFLACYIFIFLGLISTAARAQQSISDIIDKQKNHKGPVMKSLSYGSEKNREQETDFEQDASEDNSDTPDSGKQKTKSFEDISEENGPNASETPSKEEKASADIDVWEKYKTIAAGTDNKPMGSKNYSIGKKKNKAKKAEQADDNEDTDNEELAEDSSEEIDEKPKKKKTAKKKKSGMGGIIDEYESRQKARSKMKSSSLNE